MFTLLRQLSDAARAEMRTEYMLASASRSARDGASAAAHAARGRVLRERMLEHNRWAATEMFALMNAGDMVKTAA